MSRLRVYTPEVYRAALASLPPPSSRRPTLMIGAAAPAIDARRFPETARLLAELEALASAPPSAAPASEACRVAAGISTRPPARSPR